jgi:hypothetical protein
LGEREGEAFPRCYCIRFFSSSTTSNGRFITPMPAASKAAIFSSAVPELP